MVAFQEKENASIRLKGLKLVERSVSALQEILLFRHEDLGHVLVIDDELQHVEAWQALYHEPLVHLPISFIPRVRNALVLGGGDLFAVRELLKYESILSVRLIEHDQNVIDLMQAHYPHASAVLNDPRLTVQISDARTVLQRTEVKYDLVVNDCFDLSKEKCARGRSAYSVLANLLTKDGICSDVIYRHVFEKKILRNSLNQLATSERLVLSLITIPEYPGILHILTLWGRNPRLRQRSRSSINEAHRQYLMSKGNMSFEFYDPFHRGFFLYVPPYVKRAMEKTKEKPS
jgi:spermidine synthase